MSMKQNNIFANKMAKLTFSEAIQDAKVLCKTVSLKMDEIDENPRNEAIFNMDGIDELADYIKKVGLYQPITVFQKRDGRYEILTGHRKFRAKRQNGDDTIDAIVRPAPKSEGDKMHQVIKDNFLTRKLSPIDIARSMNELKNTWIQEGRNSGQLTGDTKDILAKEFDMSPSKVARYLRLLNLNHELQEFIADYSLSVDAALTIAETDNLSVDGLQDYVAKAIKELPVSEEGEREVSKADVQKMIEHYKKSQRNETEQKGQAPISKVLITKNKFVKLSNNLMEAFSADNISEFRLKDSEVENLKALRNQIDEFLKKREE